MLTQTESERVFNEITEAFEVLKTEHTKGVEKGNKSAQKRARVVSGKITKLLKEYRAASLGNG